MQRKGAWDKVTGKVAYTDDLPVAGHSIAPYRKHSPKRCKAVLADEVCPELYPAGIGSPRAGARRYSLGRRTIAMVDASTEWDGPDDPHGASEKFRKGRAVAIFGVPGIFFEMQVEEAQ